jgi:hypothetical protein
VQKEWQEAKNLVDAESVEANAHNKTACEQAVGKEPYWAEEATASQTSLFSVFFLERLYICMMGQAPSAVHVL